MLMSTSQASVIEDTSDREIRLERRSDGRLWLTLNSVEVGVRPVRCFPWSAPDAHISLRNSDEEELAYVTSAATLDRESRTALTLALEDAGLVLEILGVTEIDEDQEIRCWKVITRQGPRRFQTTLESWPRPVPGGGLLIEDVAGDLFWIADADRLDAASKKLLWAYVD